MTLTELRYIVAVAQHRHFGHAAEECHVSQPTLSVAVKRLEDELGVTLFERNHGTITVTPAGERIITQAQKALSEAAAVKEIAVASRDELDAPLRLGAIYTIGPYLLPALIPTISEQAPNMPLLVEENYTAVLTEKLKKGELDVIIIATEFNDKGVETLPIYDEQFVVLLPISHPLSQKQKISTDELADETVLLLGKGHCFRDQVLEACPMCAPNLEERQCLQKTLEGASLETIRMMVTSGVGITVLPCTAAGADRYSERLLTIRRFAGSAPHRTVSLAWRQNFPRPQAVKVLKKALQQAAPNCISSLE